MQQDAINKPVEMLSQQIGSVTEKMRGLRKVWTGSKGLRLSW